MVDLKTGPHTTRRFTHEDQSFASRARMLAVRAGFDPVAAARVRMLAATLRERDGYTAEHSEAVHGLACSAAEALDVERHRMPALELAALLHDVGKVRVPSAVLHKPAALDAREDAVMRRHASWGADLLERVPGLDPIARIVRFHHERWDGHGYPDGLSGSRIPLASRVIAVCDAFHAMTSDRPYRQALPADEALNRLSDASGSQFDPHIMGPVLDAIAEKPLSQTHWLSDQLQAI